MSNILAIWIRDHGDNMAALGRAVGISRSAMLRIVKGKNRPSVSTMRKLSEVTGIPREKLRPDLYEAN
jgi:transcriptional regulator with XRE-family HTH domain